MEITSFEAYWQAIGKMKDGIWPRYEVLPRFAFSMGAKFNDTSTVERKFSEMNFIHQNKQRNRMSQEMLDAHMHISHAVESKENRQKCGKCEQGGSRPHCHCFKVKIGGDMRVRCRKARLKAEDAQKITRAQMEVEEEEAKSLRAKTERLEKERVAKLREQLKTKTTFYSERVMSTRIYGRDSKKKEGSDGKGKTLGSKVRTRQVPKAQGSSKSGGKQKRDNDGTVTKSTKKLKK